MIFHILMIQQSSMENKKYIIKKLSPWMIDELIAFSNITKFEIILLRDQEDFYQDDLKRLSEKGIHIYIKPRSSRHFFKKLKTSLKFIFKNLKRFKFDYNFVIGFKTILWFMRTDMSKFSENDSIHAQFATQGALLSLLIKMFFNDKPAYSFTFHAHDIYFKNEWFNLLVQNSNVSFSISEFNIDYVRKNYGETDKYKLARLGVFTDIFDHKTTEIQSGKEQIVFGLLSRLVEKKGVIYLLEAMKELKLKGLHNFQLLIAGDGPLKNNLMEYVHDNELEDRVKFIGTIKGQDKIDFFESLDTFILPCIKLENDMDGIPVVFMEAIACGLPLITTNISGIPEICKNEYNGYLVEERNVDVLVDSMMSIEKHKEKRILFSQNSLNLSDSYNIQINSEKKLKDLNWI